jgi:hypothetical protein
MVPVVTTKNPKGVDVILNEILNQFFAYMIANVVCGIKFLIK